METSGFLYLNAASQWPDFQLDHLAIAPDGSLGLEPGGQAFAPFGSALGGPFSTVLDSTEWFRLRAMASAHPDGTQIQLFTYTADAGPAPYDPNTPNPFSDPGWKAIPRDRTDAVIFSDPARFLWIGLLLRGQGDSTPAIEQMRVDYGRNTYLPFLPATYARDPVACDLIERLLALSATTIGGLESEIDDLPLLFDPAAAPAGDWLQWLAGWLDFRVSGRWSAADARRYIAEAFDLYNWRGTIHGLKRYLKIYAGVDATIWEPARLASLWTLGESSSLGFTTMLAPSALEGAVLDATADLDLSRLTPDDSGAMLFEDIAHRFCVAVRCADLNTPGALDTVRAVIDREKPAHTVYDLCTIDARMRIGWQARVGIDAIVGREPLARLGMRLDDVVLAPEAKPCETEVQ